MWLCRQTCHRRSCARDQRDAHSLVRSFHISFSPYISSLIDCLIITAYDQSTATARMSIVCGSSPRADNTNGSVTKSLEMALSEFGSVLTDDERKQLQQIKCVPDASAALVFTAKLDSSNSSRRGKSIGARAYSMLQSIQQFSAIVDTFISAHPDIAALVWGSVKLTVLVSRP